MLTLQILYITSGFVALSAGGFQMSKLIKRKNSDEFNLGTWLMWTGTQGVSTTYAISLGDPLLMFISGAWASFYLAMSVLIIRYSSSRQTLFKSVSSHRHKAVSALPIEVTPDNPVQLELATEPLK